MIKIGIVMNEQKCPMNSAKVEEMEITQKVDSFLNKINFKRTFPLDFVLLAEKMGGFHIFYMSDDNTELDKIWGMVNPSEKLILLNPMFRKDKQSFLAGRYLLAKMIARYAHGDIPEKMMWTEYHPELRTDSDKDTNERTANFAFELLMPAEEFRRQWNAFGKDEIRMSDYFGVTQRRIIERAMFLQEYYASNEKR